MRKVDPRRRVLKLHEWPDADRACWERGTRSPAGLSFTESVALPRRRRGKILAVPSVEKYHDGWGRYLGWLTLTGQLDLPGEPSARVRQDRIIAYIDALHEVQNRPSAIFGRLQELVGALSLMAPGFDAGWILRPGGTPVHARLDLTPRDIEVHHPRRLYRWGITMMEQAQRLTAPCRRQVMMRDGLIIALLAARALRLRTVTGMDLATNLRREGDVWHAAFAGKDIKTGRPLEFPLPRRLARWIERYLSHERQELLAGKASDALWINWSGLPLKAQGLEKRIRWRSAKEFGPDRAFGVHRFRYGIVTVATIADPDDPSLGSKVLGITGRIAREHYDRGTGMAAKVRHQAAVLEERARTEPLAASLFDWRNRLDQQEALDVTAVRGGTLDADFDSREQG